jgi:hypothetical protein
MRGVIRFACAPNKDIENLIAAAINEPGDCAALNDIRVPILQRETVAGQLAHIDDLYGQ